ncbi:MAG: magnesium/cobalt transporter CorA [Saprospiraceae bacterium]
MIQKITYNETEVKVEKKEIVKSVDNGKVTWYNFDTTSDEAVRQAGQYFGWHHLLIEDIVDDSRHLPKVDAFDDYIFCSLRSLSIEGEEITEEHISFILGKDYLISFQENPGDVFDDVRERILMDKGRLRKRGADYLLYRLMDAVDDELGEIVTFFEDRIEGIEDLLIKEGHHYDSVEDILNLKKQLINIRKIIFPMEEVVRKLAREESDIITPTTRQYFKDVHERLLQILEQFKDFRELANNLMELHHLNLSQRTNSVMQLLTIVSTVFIPLTFIAGVYGMNFDYMPELHWQYGYIGVWVLMFIITLVMIWLTKRRNWL